MSEEEIKELIKRRKIKILGNWVILPYIFLEDELQAVLNYAKQKDWSTNYLGRYIIPADWH